MRRLPVIVGCILALGVTPTMNSQATLTWLGLGADDNFSTAANWLGDNPPSIGDDLVFTDLINPNLQNITLDGPETVGSICFTGIRNGYYINPPATGTPALTVTGNIVTDSASIYWGVFGVPIVLTSGTHTFKTAGADLYFFAPLSGSGRVVKTGASSLVLTTDNSSWTGGLTINQGNVYVSDDHALGTGTVTFKGGVIAATGNYGSQPSSVSLANNFLVGANPLYGTNAFPVPVPLSLTGTVTPISGVSTVNFTLAGNQPLSLKGALKDGAAATSYTFATGTYFSSGGNTYTGTTSVASDARLTLDGTPSVQNLVSQSITAASGGYVGFGSDASTTDVSVFLSKLNHTSFAGTIGFDNQAAASPFKGTIDLSGFTTAGVTIGTQSTATLYGAIVPQSSGTYSFTGHGTLFLGDEPAQPSYGLGGNHNLDVSVPDLAGKPFLLVLARANANSYNGATTIFDHSGIVLDSAGALSPNTSVYLDYGGYLGATDTSGLTLARTASQLANLDPNSALGFDSHAVLNGISSTPVTVNNLDLSSLGSPFYVGTATRAILAGTLLTTSGNTANYYFTGFGGGELQVDAALSGAKSVNLGLAGALQPTGGPVAGVKLTNVANTYSGGTVLNSGRLILDDPRVLGTGALTVNATSTDQAAYLETGFAAVVLANPINLLSGEFRLTPSGALSLSGNITGAGQLSFGGSSGPVTLSGNSAYSGGTILSNLAAVTAASDTAFGTGSLELANGASVLFSSSAPSIGSLLNGSIYYGEVPQDSVISLGSSAATTLTIKQNQDANYAGDIVQTNFTVSLVKTGASTLILTSPNNNYTGGTTISQGKLVAGAAGSVGTGPVTINGGSFAPGDGIVFTNAILFGANGGTLSGNGTFTTPIAVGPRVVLSPGNSPGILTFTSGLTIASGGSLIMQVQSATGAAGVGYDTVDVSGGALAITSTSVSPFTVSLMSLNAGGTGGNVADFSSSSSYSWMFFTGNTTGGITNFASNKFSLDTSGFTNALGGGSFSLVQGLSGGNPALFLNFTPVPEPSTCALLFLGATSLAISAYRRRRS